MKIRDTSGFSVMELLVAMSLMSVVMTAAFAVLFSGVKAQGYGTDLAHTQENANVTMQRFTRDLRSAGQGCSAEDTVFLFAGRNRVSFLTRRSNDTIPKVVTYYTRTDPDRPGEKFLIKAVGNDSVGKTISKHIVEFSLDYLDGYGNSLLDLHSAEPVVRRHPYHADLNRNSIKDILEIRRVAVTIRTRTRISRKGGYGTCDLESEVVPRNVSDMSQGEE
jgi:prepilin-type N-terminal cleavage/methylation domain-containing protein